MGNTQPKNGVITDNQGLHIRGEPEVENKNTNDEWTYVYVDNVLQGYTKSKYIKVDKE
jgi:hypothetical protein